ncbi:insulinase family protein [Acuticoccus sp. M5D2P5]|uniref:M16 family metallopeptidase n=1 Tax=Acuticoccus kalidii TaxID=2910977 RepID=UPI001F24BB87|nr:pitrilysin family protein [Acuticoccus kalidii]MCF3931884.1 insulinase family protein [Acuticoccus kalidii]
MYYALNRAIVAVAFFAASIGSASAIDIQEVTTPKGVSAWLVSDDTVPVVAVDIAFKNAGSSQDPAEKAGRANLLAATLDEGAGDLDSVAFQNALLEGAVQLSFDSSRDHLYGDLSTISSSVERGFDLLHLALTQPRFDQEAVDRMKGQIIAGLRREEKDPDTVVAQLWARTAFPDHPYGTPSNGIPETVATLTRDDLVAATRGLAKDNLMIAVVGDIDAETLIPLLDRAFGDLPDTAELTDVPPVEPETGLTVSETIDTPQTAIRFGGPGLAREDDDFIPAFVMNHILGGGSFSSWLFSEVREKRGLAYSVYSYLAPFEHAAIFGGGTATRNDQADEALDVIRAQFERMANEGPTEEELADAKAYLTGSYALRFDSSSAIARQLLFIQLEELGMDYIDKRNALIEAVTLDDVKRAATRIFGEGVPTVAVVGAPAG